MTFCKYVIGAVIPWLVGCNLLQSKEESCLQSSRLEFKDPDSLAVVQNLGARGQTDKTDENVFWLRYKAKNSYGAFVSGNMACVLDAGKWRRDTVTELFTRLHIEQKFYREYLDAQITAVKARSAETSRCKTVSCIQELRLKAEYYSQESSDSRIVIAKAKASEQASVLVFESLDTLPPNQTSTRAPDPAP